MHHQKVSCNRCECLISCKSFSHTLAAGWEQGGDVMILDHHPRLLVCKTVVKFKLNVDSIKEAFASSF